MARRTPLDALCRARAAWGCVQNLTVFHMSLYETVIVARLTAVQFARLQPKGAELRKGAERRKGAARMRPIALQPI